jgi:hypothetical protein
MGFGRRSNDSLVIEEREPGLPQHIMALIHAMDRIFNDAADLMALLRDRRPIPALTSCSPLDGPISVAGYEKLFEHVDDAGRVLFSTYYFTQDVKSLDPDAQYQLSLIHRNVLHFNLLTSRSGALCALEALAPPLDVILAKTAYFSNCFRSYAIVRGILSRQMDNKTLNKAMQAHQAGWMAAMKRAQSCMVNPDMFTTYAPMSQPSLIVSADAPFREGQRVIDGVVFPPDLAKILMDKMAAAQGAALRARVVS